MESMKWARGLSRSLISNVLTLDPQYVEFNIRPKSRITECWITTGTARGCGVAICSTLDKWSTVVGKNKALGRAVGALLRKENSEPVRTAWDEYPRSWTKRQIDNVLMHRCAFKSGYYPRIKEENHESER